MNTKGFLNKIDECYFINLKDRKDRLYNIVYNVDFNISRFEANDSSKFLGDKYLSASEKACFRSHYDLWVRSLESSNNILIIEDDALFVPNFKNSWNNVYSNFIPENYDIIYLGGCLPANQKHYHRVISKINKYFFNIKLNNFFEKNSRYWHMTTLSYIISPSGAKILLDSFDENNKLPVDHFIIKNLSDHRLYHKIPNLITSECFESSIN
jgi:GR25 family glycosyltransferase involved in LPS biosynthesis